MIIPVEGLPKGYFVFEHPDKNQYLLGFLSENEEKTDEEHPQRVDEIEWFDTLPTKEECLAAIEKKGTDWDCAIAAVYKHDPGD